MQINFEILHLLKVRNKEIRSRLFLKNYISNQCYSNPLYTMISFLFEMCIVINWYINKYVAENKYAFFEKMFLITNKKEPSSNIS